MMFIRKLAIDLGTINIRICIPKKGIVINEPSVVAIEATTNKVMAIGKEAEEMIGRTPESIMAEHPLKEGAIANYRATETMIRYYINKLLGQVRFFKPELMISIPAGITSTERRAVIDASLEAGAKNAYVVKSPIAAALGAGIPISSSSGNLIIDIGGGTSEVAVISLGDIVASTSTRIAGKKIDQEIINLVRKKFSLVIGEHKAEEIKKKIGSATLEKKLNKKIEVSGCNTITGLPESTIIHSSDIYPAIKTVLSDILDAVKQVLQKTPPELAADVIDKGMIITGGTAKLKNIDKLLTKVTGVPCQVTKNPDLCCAKGTVIAIENLEDYKKSVLWTK
jgi:rod shape-determining protein MreB